MCSHVHDSQNGARAYLGKLDTYITLHTVIPYHHTTGTHRSRANDTALLCRMNKICLMKKCFTSWTDQTFRLLQSSCMARPYSLLFSYKQCCPTTSEQSSGRSCRSWGIAEQRRRLWGRCYNPRPNQQTEYLTQTHVKHRKKYSCPHETQQEVLTVVLGPPPKVATTNDIVKDEADKDPGYKVERCRGRHLTRTPKDDREIDILEHIQSKLFG